MGLSLGAALTPPLIANLMSVMGWQRALLWASLPAVALVSIWAWYGRQTRRSSIPGSRPEELEEIGAQSAFPVDSAISAKQLLNILKNRNVLLARHFLSMLELFVLFALELGFFCTWCRSENFPFSRAAGSR